MGDYLKRVLARTSVATAPAARTMTPQRPSLFSAAEAQPADPFATPAIAPASPPSSSVVSPISPLAPVVTRGESIPTASHAWTASGDFAPSPRPSSPMMPPSLPRLSPPFPRDHEGNVADTPEIVVEGGASSRDREPLAPQPPAPQLTHPAIEPVARPLSSNPLEMMERRMREVMSPHFVHTDEHRTALRDDVERTARAPGERPPEPVRLAPPRAAQESRTAPRTPIGPQVAAPPPPALPPVPLAPPKLVIGRLIVEVTPPARQPAVPPAAPQIIYARAPRPRAGGGGSTFVLRRPFGLGQS
jgi:hypothetical protein